MQIRRAIPGLAAYMGLAALLLMTGSLSSAQAQVPAFRFGGEQFVQKFDVKGIAPNRQVEFGLSNETLEGWTRLVALSSLHPDRQMTRAVPRRFWPTSFASATRARSTG